MKFLTTKAHTIIGLLVGFVLLLAPAIFNMQDDAAAAVPRWIGIFIIVNELITTSPFSLIKLVPMRVHLFVDYLTGILLAASPWLFGFADRPANEWVPHLIVGILVVGYALVTNPQADDTDKLS